MPVTGLWSIRSRPVVRGIAALALAAAALGARAPGPGGHDLLSTTVSAPRPPSANVPTAPSRARPASSRGRSRRR